MKSTITVYTTSDGQKFTNQFRAVTHQQCLDYKKNGGWEQIGKPYEYGTIKIEEVKA